MATVDLGEEGIGGLESSHTVIHELAGKERGEGNRRTWERTAAATPAVRPDPMFTANLVVPVIFFTCSSPILR